MKLSCIAAAAFAAAALATTAPVHAVTVFGTNLILNGGAEDGGFSGDGSVLVPIPNFTVDGNLTVPTYDVGGGFPEFTSPGPVNRGQAFFSGGADNEHSAATQIIDVSDAAAAIDAGASFLLSAWLGGFSGQNDNAVLTVRFIDANGQVLSSPFVGPVIAADRVDANGSPQTGLFFRSTDGAVPAGTRSLSVVLDMTRTDGSYNDGYADNLSLVFTAAAVPEPASAGLLGAGLAALLLHRRRR